MNPSSVFKAMALGAIAMASASATAVTVTINFESLVGTENEITGSLSYDTEAVPFSTGTTPSGFVYANYVFPENVFSVSAPALGLFDVTRPTYPELTSSAGVDYIDFYQQDTVNGLNFNFFIQLAPGTLNLPSVPNVATLQAAPIQGTFAAFIDPAAGSLVYLAAATYTVSAVPEPATWAMLLGGIGIVGSTLRSRRQRQQVASA